MGYLILGFFAVAMLAFGMAAALWVVFAMLGIGMIPFFAMMAAVFHLTGDDDSGYGGEQLLSMYAMFIYMMWLIASPLVMIYDKFMHDPYPLTGTPLPLGVSHGFGMLVPGALACIGLWVLSYAFDVVRLRAHGKSTLNPKSEPTP